ncbi:putative ribonuclease H-like domain-containing protein [Tanacetum coccineum]
MDLETAQTTTTAKLPILKQGEYDMWRLRIEQYFQVQDYALWDVIENGNSFKPVPQTTTNADGSSTSLIPGPVTTEEKVQKKNDVKARSMLLMALPNEHLMTFNQYKDAKTLFAAIQTRFGGNEATKKTQKTLLKQIQLAILGENISQEDLNLKFLRSLPSEWNTHVVVWRNKPDLDTMSFDDLYNNFKIVEQEVKGTASSSSSSSSQNMAFVSSPSSTNEVNTAYGVSTANTQVSPASTQVSTASTQVSTANLSDDTVYAFLASQPNGSQLVYEDLEQIHEDDDLVPSNHLIIGSSIYTIGSLSEHTDCQRDILSSLDLSRLATTINRLERSIQIGINKWYQREYEFHNDNPPLPPPVPPIQQAPHTLSTIKLPILKKERERKARTTLLMSIPEDHLAKFHKMTDAKEMWEAIKSRFGGNDESKKMFQSPLSKLEIHDAGVSTEDANQKFLSTSSTNDVSTAYGVSTSSGHNSQREGSSSYTDELTYSFFANQSSGLQLDHEDLEQKTGRKLHFDAKEPIGFDKTKVECFNCHNTGHFARESGSKGNQEGRRRDTGYNVKDNRRRPRKQEEPKALVTLDGDGVDWTGHAEDEQENRELSFDGLSKLLNSQMSAKDKSGLGSSDVEDSPVYDRFANVEGMHVVPPLMTGIYMPPKFDFVIDKSEFTYGPKQSKTSESNAKTSDSASCESNSKQEKSSFAFVNTIKHVKTPRETVKEQNTCSPSPKPDKRDWNGLMSKKLGLAYGFTKKACFVCGSFSHLIIDCDFHEKRMAKQVKLNKQKVNVARQNLSSQPAATNTARKVNTARPIVNEIRPRNNFYKSHSPIRRPSNRTTTPKENFANHKVNTAGDKRISVVGGNRETAVKASACCKWRSKRHYWNKVSKYNSGSNSSKNDDPQKALKNKGIVDSGCSRHMTGNKAYLVEYQDYNGGPVAFGGSKGQITGKGKIITGKLDFEDVYFVKELKQFNLFSVSQMCDKKNKVLFTDSECLVLSPDFKLPDENQVLLRVPRQNNMYSFNLENIVPTGGLACLIAKATIDESNKWHRRLGHVNFKILNKLVKGNLVRGLPSKIFQNDHTYVACQKGKQHKASCKAKVVSSISQPLLLLHMDLFGATSVWSINHKTYCLVITDDFSRDIIEFCGSKRIKREYSNARTPQQNGVAERKNRTLIEVARTMLVDSFLLDTFWVEVVITACYVLNRVPKLSTARPKLSTNSTKIESMKLKAMMEVRRIFKCWFHYHTTNGHHFTMSNRHQELASLEKTTSGKDFSNLLMADSLPKTIWFSTHHASQ